MVLQTTLMYQACYYHVYLLDKSITAVNTATATLTITID